MPIRKIKELFNDLEEAFSIILACLSIFWFWTPIIYTLILILYIYLIFYVNPLTLFTLPGVLTAYSFYVEKKMKKKRKTLNQ